MSKVAEYLQEHVLGEISANVSVLAAASRDGSVLQMRPDLVMYPRVTNDIRKLTRFAWQLAEKGHVLPLTARGGGTDDSGAAIGKGVAIELSAHMNQILEFDPKQKLVRVQPGLSSQALANALMLHGLAIPALPVKPGETVGGAVANNATALLSGKYGDMRAWTSQLEVVLASGDLLQTGRLSKRELSKKKGLQTFEGEIYRNLDGLIEDNAQLIAEKIAGDAPDGTGYAAIAKVKHKDGSFDLTPLLVGSQGTLGIISEMILKSNFAGATIAACVVACASKDLARDTLDALRAFEPAFLEYYDSALFDIAAARGKKYAFSENVKNGAVIVLGFDEFSERARRNKLKRLAKMLGKVDAYVEGGDGEDAMAILAVRDVVNYLHMPAGEGMSAPPLLDGAYIPPQRFEEFSNAVAALSERLHVALPLTYHVLDDTIDTRPMLQLGKVSDKQKIFKILDEYSNLIDQYGGHLVGSLGEGRLKAQFAYKHLDGDVLDLYAAIKTIFDPYGLLNPGVKQAGNVRDLVAQLRADY